MWTTLPDVRHGQDSWRDRVSNESINVQEQAQLTAVYARQEWKRHPCWVTPFQGAGWEDTICSSANLGAGDTAVCRLWHWAPRTGVRFSMSVTLQNKYLNQGLPASSRQKQEYWPSEVPTGISTTSKHFKK